MSGLMIFKICRKDTSMFPTIKLAYAGILSGGESMQFKLSFVSVRRSVHVASSPYCL